MHLTDDLEWLKWPFYVEFSLLVLYEIFRDYYGENLLQIEQVLCNITKVHVNGASATFGFQCVILK